MNKCVLNNFMFNIIHCINLYLKLSAIFLLSSISFNRKKFRSITILKTSKLKSFPIKEKDVNIKFN